jgi:hypothetical protein
MALFSAIGVMECRGRYRHKLDPAAEINLDPTATTNSISVSAMTVAPTSGGVHIIIGGLMISSGTSF